MTSLSITVVFLTQMLLAATLPKRRRKGVVDHDLRFSFLIPALNEEVVIAATIDRLRALQPDVNIIVIDDASSDTTVEIAERIGDTDPRVRVLRRSFPNAQQGKGQALNWAVRTLLQDMKAAHLNLHKHFFVVLDADGRITADLIPEARLILADEHVVGAQARIRIRPSERQLRLDTVVARVLEYQQDLEFFILRYLQNVRERWYTVNLCGNGQFVRASWLNEHLERGRPAWPDCLAEDYASGLEMRVADPLHRIIPLEGAVTQQGQADLRRFWRQRARWSQGVMQCLSYVPRLWSSKIHWLAKLDMTYYLLTPWLSGAVLLSGLTQPLRRLSGHQGLTLDVRVSAVIVTANVLLLLQWLIRYQRETRASAGKVILMLASLPVYGLAVFLALPLAYKHQFMGRRTWDKSVRHTEPYSGVE